jgi:hypothetical protein
LKERIKAAALGSRELLKPRSAAPPSLRLPSIMEEQEKNSSRGATNRTQSFLIEAILVKQ